MIEQRPAPGAELPLDGHVEIVFNQAMDRDSVEQSLIIEPSFVFDVEWPDAATLRIIPGENALIPATKYTITIAETAQSADGTSPDDPITVDVHTIGFLLVSDVVPGQGAIGVEANSVITVFFNRPVVLVTIEKEISPLPLHFEPEIPGEGEWLTTSIYMWRPDNPLPGGQVFTATIDGGVTDELGAVLPEPFTWTFSTPSPAITQMSPADTQKDVPLEASIRVAFNQPMDQASVESAFRLVDVSGRWEERDDPRQAGGQRVEGQFEWEEEGQVVTFTPSQLLKLGTEYEATISMRAHPLNGHVTLPQRYHWRFETVQRPAVKSTSPSRRSTKVSPLWSRIQIAFTAPMDEETLDGRLVFNPPLPEDASITYDTREWQLDVIAEWQPSTDYTVTLLAGAADLYGNTIDEPYTFSFATGPYPPMVRLNLQERYNIYDPREQPEVLALVRNVDRVDCQIVHLSLEDLDRLTGSDDPEALSEFIPRLRQVVRNWSIDTQAALNMGYYWRIPLLTEAGGTPEPGIYLLIVGAPELERDIRLFVILANANLTYKTSFDESLVWLTDLQSGQPLSGVPVTFYDETLEVIGQGKTNAEGILEASTPRQTDLARRYYAVAEGGGVFGLVSSNWDSDTHPWRFSVSHASRFQDHSLYVYTDRPIYRPGQEVHFKGILRDKDDMTYSLPEPTDVQVTFLSNLYEIVHQDTVTTSSFGTLEGSFTLSEDASTGYYNIEFGLDDLDGDGDIDRTARVGFQVAEYHAPDFRVDVLPEQEAVMAGDTATFTVDARYFFGGPVSSGWASWEVLSRTYVHTHQGPGYYNFYDYESEQTIDDDYVPDYGGLVADGEGWLDENGQLELEIPANLDEFPTSQLFTVEALVGDGSGLWVAGRSEIVVHQGAYYVGVRPEAYIGAANEEQTASLIVVDWDGNPVADQAVTVDVIRRRWYSVKEEDDEGRTRWVTSVEETPVGAPRHVVTDEAGEATLTFVPPEGGTYRLRATTGDADGNLAQSSAFLWATSGRFIPWARSNNRRIDLVPDRNSYRPGDVAQILITSPFSGSDVQALVTVERGSILRHEVITLSGNSHVYELPITGELAPNVFVTAMLIKGADDITPVPEFRMGIAEIEIEPAEQTLTLVVTPDRDTVGPGEKVTYTVEARDSTGKPVDAEVSLALVDLATLSLARPDTRLIAEHFYREQYLGVKTALSLIQLVDPLDDELLEKAKGGGGGGIESYYDTRTEFKDTAYWRAKVRTGADGVVEVTVTLPDNLTTWRMDARAVTADTKVGQTEVDIRATKPLLVRPVTPRFFVVGDKVTLSAIVSNNTDQDIEAKVWLQAGDVAVLEDVERQVVIPANAKVDVSWPVVVETDEDWVDLVFSAEGGGLSDSAKPSVGDPAHDRMLPVYRYETPEVVGTSGQLTGRGMRVEGVALPAGFDAAQSQVDVQINPSLAAPLIDGLHWLENYPFECTEQTVGRFLPNVLTLQALKTLGLPDAELEANLETQLSEGLQSLYAQQHVDGGWGWFVSSESNPTVSAYVLQGLVAAREAGFEVDEQVYTDGLFYLRRQLRPPKTLTVQEKNRQAYLLYVLAEAHQPPDISRTIQLYEGREGLQHWARAMLAQTLWILNPDDSRLDSIKSDLVNAAVVSATGVHWEEDEPDYWNWNTDTRSTAIILDTFARLWPDSELAPGIVRWLMTARESDHWRTTQETAWALIGLADWMAASHELEADYDWQVSLNDQLFAEGYAGTDTLQDSSVMTVDAGDLLSGRTNHIAIQRTNGPGHLYYGIHLTTHLPVEEVEPLSRGVVVTRRYLDEEGRPVTQGHVSETFTVELTIIAPQDLHYFVAEDFYPAGAHPVDTDLLTESVLGEFPHLSADDPLALGWGWWWFSRSEFRDEKAVFYTDRLPLGTYQFTYQIRLGVPGEYHVIPSTAQEFYFPEVYGRGEGTRFVVLPEE